MDPECIARHQTVPVTALLIALASFNALFLFTHTKLYHMHAQPDPVSSPHARFVAAPADPPPLARRLRTQAWRAAAAAWRFLLGIGTSAASRSSAAESARRVQELEVWTPDARELALFCVYSPVHALLWTAWNSGNWILVACAMAGVSAQVSAFCSCARARWLTARAIAAAHVDGDVPGAVEGSRDHRRGGHARVRRKGACRPPRSALLRAPPTRPPPRPFSSCIRASTPSARTPR